MKRTSRLAGAFGVLALALAGLARADTPPSDDSRLRETLRSTMQQLQDAQSQLATVQAAQASDADEIKKAQDELALVKKHGEDDRTAAAKSIEELKGKLAAAQDQAQQMTRTALAWKSLADKEAATIQTTTAARDQAARQAVGLQRTVDDLKVRNFSLFALGTDILNRFEKFSLGEQFAAKEPFIGETRVRLENLIQDYDDKLMAERAPAQSQ